MIPNFVLCVKKYYARHFLYHLDTKHGIRLFVVLREDYLRSFHCNLWPLVRRAFIIFNKHALNTAFQGPCTQKYISLGERHMRVAKRLLVIER